MTAVNRIASEAKRGASEVWLRETEVRGVAEHFRLLSVNPNNNIDLIADGIRAGRMKILGVPVRVKKAS